MVTIQPSFANAAEFFNSLLTVYDERHVVTYMRLLEAEKKGADWKEVTRLVLHIDAERELDRARNAYLTHLARAKWVTEQGRLLRGTGSN
jgi:hypothetical protein